MSAAAPPFCLDEYVASETAFHESVASALDRLLRPPAVWTAFPAGHIKLTPAQQATLFRIGLKTNWPDILVLHVNLIGIELKSLDGELSHTRIVRNKRTGRPRIVQGQREVFPLLRAAGMRGPYVCKTLEHVLHVLECEGVPMLSWRVAA